MITLKSCPNCKSRNFIEYKTVPWGYFIAEIISGVKFKAAIIVRHCQCQECKLIFQNPRMSDMELDKYYGSGFYRKTINPPPEGMDKGEENRAKTDAIIIKKNAGSITSHLDIGCGGGYLLREISADRKVGIESDPGYVKVKGIEIYKDLSQIPYKKYDLITVIHLLEHVPRPLDYLRKLVKFVKPMGYLVIEVPSDRTPGDGLGLPHMSKFETDVLKLMCKQVGLEVLQTEFTPHLLLICKKAS